MMTETLDRYDALWLTIVTENEDRLSNWIKRHPVSVQSQVTMQSVQEYEEWAQTVTKTDQQEAPGMTDSKRDKGSYGENSRRNGAVPLVVPTEALGDVIRSYAEKHNRSRPTGNNAVGIRLDSHFTSAYDYITETAQCHHRALYRVVSGETAFTSMWLTDDILTAIGRCYLLGEDDMPLYPNPRWTRQRFEQNMIDLGCDLSDPFWRDIDALLNGFVQNAPFLTAI